MASVRSLQTRITFWSTGGTKAANTTKAARTDCETLNDSRRWLTRRRLLAILRFTTRDLLWLMVAVGIACGWWISLAKARATWRTERDQIFVEWRKEREQDGDFRLRVNIELSKLPTAQRDELFRAIIVGGDAEFRTNPDQSMLLPSKESRP